MRLRWLDLREYKVLRNLKLPFGPAMKNGVAFPDAPSYNLDFLVGLNGSGKSTVLKALFVLMKKLKDKQPIDFPFELEYELEEGDNKRRIKFSNLYQDLEAEEIRFRRTPNAWEIDAEGRYQNLELSSAPLPKRVVAFTTGNEESWESLEEKFNAGTGSPESVKELPTVERFIKEIPGKPPNLNDEAFELGESDVVFIPNRHAPLVTLCGLLTDFAEFSEQPRLTRVMQESKIGDFAGFSLKFRKTQQVENTPDWLEVERLGKLATHSLRTGSDYLLVFNLKDSQDSIPQRIIQNFGDGFSLFKILTRLSKEYEGGQSVLREVNLFIERSPGASHPESEHDDPPLHLLEWLSDGERSFLGRMCLFSLLGATEALILLDEPEVHFNDFWKRQIVSLLDEILQDRCSHVLISTHSSITLTDVRRENIVVLDRNASYTENSFRPGLKTFGADPSDIMVHVFGAPHPSGERSTRRIENELDNVFDRNSSERQEVLKALLESVVAQGYWSYLIRRELEILSKE